MTDEKRNDEATSELARSLYHASNQRIKIERDFNRDLDTMRKKYGWAWGQRHPINN